jgi:hypothetical protein
VTWAKASSVLIAVAVALIIIANTPAVLTDMLATAVAQIRVNAATTQPTVVTIQSSETMTGSETSVKKAK